MATWAGTYALGTLHVQFRDNTTVFLTDDGEVQPDVLLFREASLGRSIRLVGKGYLEGTPDLVVEIAASSASYDLHDKKDAYARAGVPEFVAWRVFDNALDWFRLKDGAYSRVEPDADGVIESAVFPGLRLNVTRLLAGDHAAAIGLAPAGPPAPADGA